MKPLTLLACLSLVLSMALAGCSTTVVVNPTAAAAVDTAVATVTIPPSAATQVSSLATDVASTVVPQVQTVAANVTVPPVTVPPVTPLPPEVASAVITTYAKSQLGIDVKILQATGGVGELQLPKTAQGGVQEALKLAGTSYGALLQGGIAVVALGRGTASGDYEALINWASLGAFTMRTDAPYPANADEALALVKKTYPRLADLTFTPQQADQGYAFISNTNTSAVDPSTGNTQTVGKVVIGGVVKTDLGGLVLVYAVVGNGSMSQPLAATPTP